MAQGKLVKAEHDRDAALLACKDAGVLAPDLEVALGGVSRWWIIRRVREARASGIEPRPSKRVFLDDGGRSTNPRDFDRSRLPESEL